MARKTYSFTLDPEIMEEAELMASLDHSSMSRFIEVAIITLSKEKLKKSEKAIQDLLTIYKNDCLRAIVDKKKLPEIEAYVEANKHILVGP